MHKRKWAEEEEKPWSEVCWGLVRFYIGCLIVALLLYCVTSLAEREAEEKGERRIRQQWEAEEMSRLKAMHAKEEKYG